MDTGEEFYINDFSIFKTAPNNKKYQKIQDGITGYSLKRKKFYKRNLYDFLEKMENIENFQ